MSAIGEAYRRSRPGRRSGSAQPAPFCLVSVTWAGTPRRRGKEDTEVSSTLLLIILVIVLLAVVPAWPYSRGWGYGPSGILGLIVVILIIMLLMGRL
jgi:Protein of unknown function (DUF3309)